MKEKEKEKEQEKELKPSAVEILTGEKPKPKEVVEIDEKPINEVLNKNEDDNDDDEESRDEVVRELFNKDNLAMTTDISRKGAVVMARAEMISEIYDIPILKDFANSIKEHLVSNKRLGRKELVDVKKSIVGDMAMEEGEGLINPSLGQKIWSGGK